MPKCRATTRTRRSTSFRWAASDNDLVYRDPWGNPYVISMDLNYDEQCQDAFYCLTAVSSTAPPGNPTPGINGLINPDGTGSPNNYRNITARSWSGPPGRTK